MQIQRYSRDIGREFSLNDMNDFANVRIAHTVLHPDWIAAEAARRYPLSGAVKAYLLYRGMNDVYLIQDRNTRYAMRVWRRGWRDVEVVQVELDFLDYLRCRNFPASTPLRTRGGELYFKVGSPEGERAVAMYSWAPGQKFGEALDKRTAERIGALLAQMHLLGLEYLGDRQLSTDDVVSFTVSLQPLLEFLHDRPEDAGYYERLAPRIVERLEQVPPEAVPLGLCHRDFHPANVHVDENGGITFLDFDGTGQDFFMQDVKNFTFGNLFFDFPSVYGEAFERGYASVRPFTAEELEHSELFLLAKAFRLISGMAHASVAVGRGALRFRNLDWFSAYIRARARNVGLQDRMHSTK
ncbi:MAG: phosphotransferase [Gammaproteobacteria bacterium]|nr:phosphotransferase [Gammaproteobacteria bacterium]MDE0414447.1 phosphotransferase [Gammaproteobacteria bacterium]